MKCQKMSVSSEEKKLFTLQQKKKKNLHQMNKKIVVNDKFSKFKENTEKTVTIRLFKNTKLFITHLFYFETQLFFLNITFY